MGFIDPRSQIEAAPDEHNPRIRVHSTVVLSALPSALRDRFIPSRLDLVIGISCQTSLTTIIRLHPAKLAVQPRLQILRQHRRLLLLRTEHAHRSALEDHFHRAAIGLAWVTHCEDWYNSSSYNARPARSRLTARKSI